MERYTTYNANKKKFVGVYSIHNKYAPHHRKYQLPQIIYMCGFCVAAGTELTVE